MMEDVDATKLSVHNAEEVLFADVKAAYALINSGAMHTVVGLSSWQAAVPWKERGSCGSEAGVPASHNFRFKMEPTCDLAWTYISCEGGLEEREANSVIPDTRRFCLPVPCWRHGAWSRT